MQLAMHSNTFLSVLKEQRPNVYALWMAALRLGMTVNGIEHTGVTPIASGKPVRKPKGGSAVRT